MERRRRCAYSDCKEQHPEATDDERVTCETCREELGLPPLEEESEVDVGPREVLIKDALNAVGMLIVILLAPAEAGGMSEDEARRIHQSIMEAYCNLDPEAMDEMLLPDIIEKWVPLALPFARGRNYFGPEGNG